MKVSFELSPKDIRYFRERLKTVRASDAAGDEGTVIELSKELVAEALASEPPEFVVERLGKLEELVEMLVDDEWRLTGRDRVRILDALAYFVDPEDLIPDRVPGLGYLDDAIMVELIAEELKHDIKAYQDFCEYRKKLPKTKAEKAKAAERLTERRSRLQGRMRRRRRHQRESQRGRGSSKKSALKLW